MHIYCAKAVLENSSCERKELKFAKKLMVLKGNSFVVEATVWYSTLIEPGISPRVMSCMTKRRY